MSSLRPLSRARAPFLVRSLRHLRNLRVRSQVALLLGASAFVVASTTLGACADDPATSAPEQDEAGTGPTRNEAGTDTGARTDDDAATDARDDAADARADAADAGPTKDANVADANGPGAAGALCSVNRDCQLALRCECSEDTGCECKAGARGTGKNGIDACVDGNACASSLCVEGPPSTGNFCSDECLVDADCGGKLPVCKDIAFVGRICVRTPPI